VNPAGDHSLLARACTAVPPELRGPSRLRLRPRGGLHPTDPWPSDAVQSERLEALSGNLRTHRTGKGGAVRRPQIVRAASRCEVDGQSTRSVGRDGAELAPSGDAVGDQRSIRRPDRVLPSRDKKSWLGGGVSVEGVDAGAPIARALEQDLVPP